MAISSSTAAISMTSVSDITLTAIPQYETYLSEENPPQTLEEFPVPTCDWPAMRSLTDVVHEERDTRPSRRRRVNLSVETVVNTSCDLPEQPPVAAVTPTSPIMRKKGPRGRHVQKPDAGKHDKGTPSSYCCSKPTCTGFMPLDSSVPLEHGDLSTCALCATKGRYCSTCDGFFNHYRVVCHAIDATWKYARNGQHSLGHTPRANFGGRQRKAVPELPEADDSNSGSEAPVESSV